jgi:signal transduction histidine kinase/CheY-like chemotaxis protein/PAS domain-containing protein
MYNHDAPSALLNAEDSESDRQPSLYPECLAWIALPALFIATGVMTWLRVDMVWNPLPLVIILNVIFLMGASFFVATLAARSHLIAPSISVLLLGAGALALGLAGAATGWTQFWGGGNLTATMFRGTACISGFCHLAGASTDLWPKAQRLNSRWPLVIVAYSCVLIATAGLFWLFNANLLPILFVPGTGATTAGYVAGAVGCGFFALASVIMLAHSPERASWKRWYGYGLGLLAISLLALSLQINLGDPTNWVSRIARFLGSVYLLAAVWGSVRREGNWALPLELALRKSEADLRSANERLALALRAARAGFFDWDMKENSVYRSPELAALVEAPAGASKWTRESWLQRIAPEDRPKIEEIELQCIKERRKNIDLEFRALLPGIGIRWLGRQGALYYDEEGAPVRMIGINMDITERKRAEKLAETINSINDVIHSTLDIDEIMQRAVSSGAQALGCQTATISLRDGGAWTIRYVYGFPQEIIGCQKSDAQAPYAVQAIETRKPIAVNDANHDPAAKCCHKEEGSTRATLVVPLITKDETIGVLSLNHHDPNLTFDHIDVDFAGKLASALSLALQNGRLWREVQKELSERKRVEDELRQFNTELEARVAERTTQLVQAQKLEALGQLTGGLAHDFNNLLSVILGNVELLRKRLGGDERALRLANNAIQGAERGAVLTKRMLAFARRQDLQPGAVSMSEVVSSLLTALHSSLESSIEIKTDLPNNLWAAQVDSNQLELALLNLAVNARDAIREKPDSEGGSFTLSARNESVPFSNGQLTAGDYVALAITDTGVGMTEETLTRAADPFFTTKRPEKGAGLGLSMVQGLAVQSGGALRLSSTPGEGSTVELWLPRAPAPAPADEHSDPLAPAGSNSITVLVVDDDALVCVAAADVLVDLGHRVYEAQSAQEALAILEGGKKVDLVLTDHIMPGMTGLQLAREIQTRWPGLPTILATGYSDTPDDKDLKLLPRLYKPYDQNALAAAVSEALHSTGSDKGAAAGTNHDVGHMLQMS